MQGFFTKLKQHKRNITQSARQQLFDLVKQIADGGEPSETDVLQVLELNSLAVEDLQSLVDLLIRRRSLVEQIRQAKDAEKKRSDIQRRIAAADALLEAAEKLHEETTSPLVWQMQNLNKLPGQIMAAETELTNTAGREAQQLLDEARRDLKPVWHERHRLTTLLEIRTKERDHFHTSYKPWLDGKRPGEDESKKNAETTIARLDKDIDQIKTELTAASSQAAMIETRIKELELARLNPLEIF